MARLERSLAELGIARPMRGAALGHVMRETVRRNRVRNGLVYLQVTRGEGPREFAFPAAGGAPHGRLPRPQHLRATRQEALAAEGIAVKTMPDIRWRRSDIKTVMLLPACLAKDAARREGAREAWFVDADGFVTEGASSNAWIVDAGGDCHHAADHTSYSGRGDPGYGHRRATRGERAIPGAAVPARRKRWRQRRLSSRRRRTRLCRSFASMGRRSATAAGTANADGCARNFISMPRFRACLSCFFLKGELVYISGCTAA